MNTDHRFFEMQCALAVVGELDERASAELMNHAAECAECRHRLAEMASVVGKLSNLHCCAVPGGMPREMMERFRARAIREGIPLRRQGSPSLRFVCAAFAMAVLCVVLFGVKSVEQSGSRATAEQATHETAIASPQPIVRTATRAQPRRRPEPPTRSLVNAQRVDMPSEGGRFTTSVAHFNPAVPGNWNRAIGAEAPETETKPATLRWSIQLDPDAGCDVRASHAQLEVLRFKPSEDRRVFCYNPQIDSLAALTPLDLHHAAESNLRNAAFEMPLRTSQ